MHVTWRVAPKPEFGLTGFRQTVKLNKTFISQLEKQLNVKKKTLSFTSVCIPDLLETNQTSFSMAQGTFLQMFFDYIFILKYVKLV